MKFNQKVMRIFVLLLPLLFLSISSQAQVIDDSALEDLQNKGIRFVEGKFVAYLADTVSPDFTAKAFAELDIQILELDIEPLVIRLVNNPSDSTLRALHAHPSATVYMPKTKNGVSEYFETISNLEALIKEQQDNIRSMDSNHVASIFIEFDYSINQSKLREFLRAFDDLAYVIYRNNPRTVTLKAEAGNEFELMDKVQQLPFVESTTLIGQIDY
jgi:hypothetical protein